MHNKDVIFDLENNRVGIIESNCSARSLIFIIKLVNQTMPIHQTPEDELSNN